LVSGQEHKLGMFEIKAPERIFVP